MDKTLAHVLCVRLQLLLWVSLTHLEQRRLWDKTIGDVLLRVEANS